MKWLSAAFIDWAIVAVAIYVGANHLILLPIAMLVVGNRQHALAVLGHDGAHRLICKSKFLNDLLANVLTFYPMGLCLKQYRKWHWEHHRNTNTDKDPEIPLRAVHPNPIEMPFEPSKIWRHVVMDLFGFGIPQMVAFMIHVRPRKISEFVSPCIALAATALLIYSGLAIVPIIWFGSLFTTFWAFIRYRTWTEHIGGEEGETLIFDTNRIQQAIFFPHNIHLHHEHHEKPGIPFHKLPRRERSGKTLCEARLHGNFRKSR